MRTRGRHIGLNVVSIRRRSSSVLGVSRPAAYSTAENMKIGLIIYGSLDTLSGGYLYDRMLVDYLRAQGDTVEIISLPWRNYAAHLTDNFWFRLSLSSVIASAGRVARVLRAYRDPTKQSPLR